MNRRKIEIFFIVCQIFLWNSNISKHEIINKRDITNDEYINFYKTIEINYFYQLLTQKTYVILKWSKL